MRCLAEGRTARFLVRGEDATATAEIGEDGTLELLPDAIGRPPSAAGEAAGLVSGARGDIQGRGPVSAEAALRAAWARAEPHLSDALAHARGTHELEDLITGFAQGRLQLWVGERAAAVSELLTFPRQRALNIFLAGGDLKELQRGLPGMEAWARGQGCEAMIMSVRLSRSRKRSGWEGAFPEWEAGWIVMHRRLT